VNLALLVQQWLSSTELRKLGAPWQAVELCGRVDSLGRPTSTPKQKGLQRVRCAAASARTAAPLTAKVVFDQARDTAAGTSPNDVEEIVDGRRPGACTLSLVC
jgi:hypothetical protein